MAKHSESPQRVFRILGRVFGGVGGAMLAVVALVALVRSSAISSMTHSDGTVVELRRDNRAYRPIVEFAPAGGAAVRFEATFASSPPAFKVGEHVDVLYPPSDPKRALINSFWQIWFFPALIALIATPFVLLGLGMSLVGRRG